MKYPLALALWLLSTGALAAQQEPVPVPSGGTPHIDGRIGAEEWRGATRVVLPDSTGVRLLRDGTHLHVGIELPGRGVGSLCVLADGVVSILHASAALGTARYRPVAERWQPVQGFDYTMRETDDGEVARGKRAAFLAEHGWVASTVGMAAPAGTLEYRIRLEALGAEPRLGVAALALGEGRGVTVWPEDMADDCGNLDLVRGDTPPDLRFEPARWLRLELR